MSTYEDKEEKGIKYTYEEILHNVVEEIDANGREVNAIVPILFGVQKRLKYIPDDAIKIISRLTKATPIQVTEIATFYSKFKHEPVGQHVIHICSGLVCHQNKASDIEKAIRDYLKIEEGTNYTRDNKYSIEKTYCLGVCSVSPAISIDGKLYCKIDISHIEDVFKDFEDSHPDKKTANKPLKGDVEAEIQVCNGKCCIAMGSKDILTRILEIKNENDLQIRIKPTGCSGLCSLEPSIKIVRKNGMSDTYTNVKPKDVDLIMLKNFPTWKTIVRLNEEYKDKYESGLDAADDLLAPLQQFENEYSRLTNSQKKFSTLYGGTMSPVSLNEYIAKGGMNGIKRAISTYKQEGTIEKMLSNDLYEQNKKTSVGEAWKAAASFSEEEKKEKYIICFDEEGDIGSFKGRVLYESFAFRIIEGMLITGYATGITKGLIQVDAVDSLVTSRLKNAIAQCTKAGYLGKELFDSDFSFEINVSTNPSEYTSSNDIEEFDDMSIVANSPETLCKIPSIIGNDKSDDEKEQENTIIASIFGRVNRPGYYEVSTKTTIRQLIDIYGCGVKDDQKIKAIHIGGLQGGFITPEMLDLQYNHPTLKEHGIKMGSGSLIVITDEDDIVDLTKEMLSVSCEQSCGKCTMCRVGTTIIKNDIDKLIKGEMDNSEFAEMEELCQDMTIGSICDFGKNATNSLKSGLTHFRKDFENLIKKDIHIQQ